MNTDELLAKCKRTKVVYFQANVLSWTFFVIICCSAYHTTYMFYLICFAIEKLGKYANLKRYDIFFFSSNPCHLECQKSTYFLFLMPSKRINIHKSRTFWFYYLLMLFTLNINCYSFHPKDIVWLTSAKIAPA